MVIAESLVPADARRILVVSNHLPPQVVGGAELVAWRQMVGLAKRGYTVEGLTVHWESLPDTAIKENDGLKIHRVPASRSRFHPGRDTRRFPRFERELDSLVSRLRPHVVHFHHVQGLPLSAARRTRLAGCRVVATIHDAWGVCPKGTLLKPDLSRCPGFRSLACIPCIEADRGQSLSVRRRIAVATHCRRVRRASRHVDRLLFPSEHHLRLYNAFGYPIRRARVVPNAIDGSSYEWTPPPVAASQPGPLRLLYVGGLGKHKGLDVLLAALGRLPEGTAVLRVHGRGSSLETDRITGLVNALGLAARVELGGPVANAAVPRAMIESDLVVVPSICVENSPLSILEAHAAGRPVVAASVGGVPESIQDGVTGYCIEPGNPGALADRIRHIAEDRDHHRALCQASREAASRRTLDAHLDAVEAVYAELLSIPERSGT